MAPIDLAHQLITHSQHDMLRQRVYAIVQGYEDLNDHAQLRRDTLLQSMLDRDRPLASVPTLCRLENRASRAAAWALHAQLVETFIASCASPLLSCSKIWPSLSAHFRVVDKLYKAMPLRNLSTQKQQIGWWHRSCCSGAASALRLQMGVIGMKRLGAVLTAIVCVGAVAGNASADIIFSSGAPTQDSAILSDRSTDYFDLAQSFRLAAGQSTVTDAHWWGTCDSTTSGCTSTDSFNVSIYADAGSGLPGNLIADLITGSTANRTATGQTIVVNSIKYAEYEYSIDFGPIVLDADTLYWIAISNDTGGGLVNWFWERTAPGLPSAFMNAFTEPEWSTGWGIDPDPTFAVQLTNDGLTVPEPGTLALLGISLMGLAAVRRRST